MKSCPHCGETQTRIFDLIFDHIAKRVYTRCRRCRGWFR